MNISKIAAVVIALVAMLAPHNEAKAQQLAVNTDMLWDVAMMPNLGIEMTTGDKSTLSVNLLGGYKPFGRDIKAVAVQPEFRYFISGRPMYHHFIGIGAVAATYNLSLRSRVYDGYGVGLGVTFGYVMPLSRRLNIDFHAGLGAFVHQQKEYSTNTAYDDGNGVNAHGYFIAPTRIGISLNYIIK